jgi:TctA family transporter
MLISRGDIFVFVKHPISAVFVGLSALLILLQIYLWLRRARPPIQESAIPATPSEAES